MEDRKLQIKQARSGMNRIGAVMLVYYLIMNTAASLVLLADALVYLLGVMSRGETIGIGQLTDRILVSATSNGWGSVISAITSFTLYLPFSLTDVTVPLITGESMILCTIAEVSSHSA